MHRNRQQEREVLIGLAETLATSGISKLLLHAWERRYGLEPTERSPTGRRFYTREQVERLRLLKTCSDGGHRISSLVPLSNEALSRLECELAGRQTISEIIEAIKDMDSDRLQALLQARAETEAPEDFIRVTALPLMREVGSKWAAGEVSIAAEHMTTAYIKRVLGGLFDRCPMPSPDAPRLIATTPEKEDHDVGALVVTLLARLRGWNALFLGASLPARDIADAARRREVVCVCLSALVGRRATLQLHLETLRSSLSPYIDIWIGGAAYGNLPPITGVSFMSNMDVFLEALATAAPALQKAE
ncbi:MULTISPECIES: MerR family transcriptional regulator [unclassified Agrobacterium]|jgi:methanogenic corrinoid protein MtbC1|uniref:MerR family transcriptional regulator n=1 Tax=unclassified Agrobacterium TaxID=2632611 RepID=UPI000858C3D0|nr:MULTISPECIES: B12-binding domain-containing protein [unclassified Agrobacterium]AOG12121.1 merR HTH regulatory family protein [Agrobacterium sp. RAC06]QGG89727.1 MerR family transcriptional regulator [Agrobacterium sp. MA01]